jgi:hypothetical protein
MISVGSYLAVMEGVLGWVCKARALARCPPPEPELQLGKLEAQLVRLVNEGRAVMTGTAVAPDPATPTSAPQIQNHGSGRSSGRGDGRPLVDKGKGRMVMPSQPGNRDVEMPDGTALLADLKKKARILGLMASAGGTQVLKGSAAAGAVDEEDLEMAKLVNMDTAGEDDVTQQRS